MMEANLIGNAEMSFAPVIQAEQPQSNVAQIIAVLSGREVMDVRAHFHRDGGRRRLRDGNLTCSDSELCSVVEWFAAAAKSDRWND